MVYLVTVLLAYSGLAVGWEGRPAMEALLGGHAATGAWHRWAGYVLAGGLLLVAVVRARAARAFLVETLRFRRTEWRWWASWPRAALWPRRHAPARHEGHFDPGQRLLNLVLLAAAAALTVTGVIMAMPSAFTPAAFGTSLRVHRVATWVLLAAVAGHLLVASGILPGYRGVWRAMHHRGQVPATLAHRLWPRWTEAQPNQETREARERADGHDHR